LYLPANKRSVWIIGATMKFGKSQNTLQEIAV